jgi:glycosyltransferase involved in cell wall biosynthesis
MPGKNGKIRPKIAVIGLKGLPALGGAATVGENIMCLLKDSYDFTVLSISSHTELKTGNYNGINQVVFRKIPVKRLNIIWYYIRSAFYCLSGKYDVIHVHHRVTGLIIPLLRIRHKVVYTSHSVKSKDNFEKLPFLFNIVEYMAVVFSNIVTAVSKTAFDGYQTIRKKGVFLIPNGVNQVDVKNINRIDEDYLLFAAGRIMPLKGCHFLLQAMHSITIKTKLYVLGNMEASSGAYKNELLDLSSGLTVEFTGMIKDRARLYEYVRNARLFIFPSIVEAMSMMLIETASLEVPVICSDIPANTQLFNDNEVLFFESKNVTDLAEKIQWAYTNYAEMKRKAKNAYNKVNSDYLWETIANKYNDVFKQLI